MNAKNIVVNSLFIIVLSYVVTFTIVGIFWDPNGVILFERPFNNAIMIVGSGLFISPFLGIRSFFSNHPIPIAMGLGFLACLMVSIAGINEVTGRRLLYVLEAFLIVLGTIQFCLMA